MSKQLLDTPAKHSPSLIGLLDHAYNSTREYVFSSAHRPIISIAETAVVALMQKITVGHLRVLTYSNIYTFPAPSQELEESNHPDNHLKAELRVVNDAFWMRLLTMGDLGFSEAYMFGDVECDDLVALFKIFLANRERLMDMNSFLTPLFSMATRITCSRFVNTLTNSRSNISAHYDISNAMFESFLSEDMTYSCAIFDDLDGDLKRGMHDAIGSEALSRFGESHRQHSSFEQFNFIQKASEGHTDLHEAQMRKLRHILKKADIRKGQRVLEIGSGWGSFAILAVQTTQCEVDTITLSVQQQTLAMKRIAECGLQDKIRVHLVDYRALPAEWKGQFDRIVSIEMIEAVGREFLDEYFKVLDWALKPKGGVGVIQSITIPEARFERYIRETDFIQKWIFPGGFLPTVTLLLSAMQRGSQGRLICDSIVNIGPHYSRTLREWRRRFQHNFSEFIAPALVAEHPEILSGGKGDHELEVFKRKWLYYYCYCEVGFTNRVLGDHIVTFVREGSRDYCVVVTE